MVRSPTSTSISGCFRRRPICRAGSTRSRSTPTARTRSTPSPTGSRSTFPGSDVTTSSDVADQVSGSLVDAKNLSGKLGTALAIVALLGAFGITTLVTLSSINKRTRELGTLKAIGWRQWLVVRQVAGESVAQGLLGGLAGAVIGIAAAAAIGAAGISLDASVASTSNALPGPPGGAAPPGGEAGSPVADAAATAVSTVTLGAPVSVGMILAAIGLAVLGGLSRERSVVCGPPACAPPRP